MKTSQIKVLGASLLALSFAYWGTCTCDEMQMDQVKKKLGSVLVTYEIF